MRIAIVIQGPILSIGRSSLNLGWRELKASDITKFNCIETINSYFEKYSKDYEIICSSWENEDQSLKNSLISKIGINNVLFNKDTTRPLRVNKASIVPLNNKFRQIYSTLCGLKYLKHKGCSKFIKVRTDQEIDIKLVANQLEHSNKFLIPLKNKNDLAYMSDFYFAGEIDLCISMFENYLSSNEKHSNVHYDYTFSFASFLMNTNFYFSKYYKKESNFFKIIYKKKLRLLWMNYFKSLDEQIYNNLKWRGKNNKLKTTN